MLISIVVPAFNEADYLAETIGSLNRAKAFLRRENDLDAEIIVVDNDSDDLTAEVARDLGALVVREAQHNIAKVRNTGARFSSGETRSCPRTFYLALLKRCQTTRVLEGP